MVRWTKSGNQVVRWPDEGKKSSMSMLGALRPLSFALSLCNGPEQHSFQLKFQCPFFANNNMVGQSIWFQCVPKSIPEPSSAAAAAGGSGRKAWARASCLLRGRNGRGKWGLTVHEKEVQRKEKKRRIFSTKKAHKTEVTIDLRIHIELFLVRQQSGPFRLRYTD